MYNGEVVPHDANFTPDQVVRRAESRMGEAGYNLVFNNCEHFANWCKDGDERSEQVRRAPVVVVAARGAAAVAGAGAAFIVAVIAVPVVAALAAPVAGGLAARAAWKWMLKKG